MLNLPNIEYTHQPYPTLYDRKPISIDDVKCASSTVKSLATQVYRYTVAQGSKLKVFCSHPSTDFSYYTDALPPDADGQYWPNFAYVRGRITCMQGTDEVVAVPLKNSAREMPQATVLQHCVDDSRP